MKYYLWQKFFRDGTIEYKRIVEEEARKYNEELPLQHTEMGENYILYVDTFHSQEDLETSIVYLESLIKIRKEKKTKR